jgi:hypothetical protein
MRENATGHKVAARLRMLEERVLDPPVRQSEVQLSRLLADEFVEIGRSGRIYDKQAVIRVLAAERSRRPRRSPTKKISPRANWQLASCC